MQLWPHVVVALYSHGLYRSSGAEGPAAVLEDVLRVVVETTGLYSHGPHIATALHSYGSIELWPYIVYGPVQLWPYVVMASSWKLPDSSSSAAAPSSSGGGGGGGGSVLVITIIASWINDARHRSCYCGLTMLATVHIIVD